MNILYILHTCTSSDGSSKAFLHFIANLSSKGINPLVVCPTIGGIYDELCKQNIPVVALHTQYRPSAYPPIETKEDKLLFLPRLIGRWIVNLRATFQLLHITRKFTPDIIHTNSSVCAIGYYVSRITHIPHVWHIREYGALNFNFYYYYPSKKHQIERYRHTNSYTICITKDIQKYNHIDTSATSKVIYDGVLPSSAITYNSHKQKYLLYAGYLTHIKGVIPLLNAYIQYRDQYHNPLPLYIAGGHAENEYWKQICTIIKDNSLTEHIHILGLRKDILNLYQNAQALIIPSLSEGFGLVATEAMFSGCLVIGNDVAGIKEQFDNGKQLIGEDIGLRYTTQEQLVQFLLDVTEATHNGTFTQIYEPMILRAQKVVRQLYTTEQNAQQIYQFYEEICSQNN